MVNMEIIKTVVREIDKGDIILCKDKKGNWLHKDWCLLPYYDKGLGCPRFFKDCFKEPNIFDIADAPFIIVGIKCDFEGYLLKMKELHKNWSDRKLRTVIYYQNHLNKVLKDKCLEVIKDYHDKGYRNLFYMDRPEIHGVFIIAMMIRMGYEIELKPEKILWKICLIGYNYKNIFKYRTLLSKNIMEYFK